MVVRTGKNAADLGWTVDGATRQVVTAAVDKSLEQTKINLQGIELNGTSAHILIRNERSDAVQFQDSLRFGNLPEPLPGSFPRVGWSVGPYWRYSLFDPGEPFRADVGIRQKGITVRSNRHVRTTCRS